MGDFFGIAVVRFPPFYKGARLFLFVYFFFFFLDRGLPEG